MRYRLLMALTTCTIAFALSSQIVAVGQESPSPSQDLSSLSLEDLTHVDVSSVSRKPQELFKTPAAVFVITREDIQAFGANSLPELFRIVPGMQVAQIDASNWAVSARGFNSRYADKMLVLIDGRSIYSEFFDGVYWDQSDVSLEDVDRIEVIRGPGGALWGANAVNGVINIITRSATQSLGTKLVGVGGSLENGGSIRHGGEIGQNFRYGGFVKYMKHSALRSDDGASAHDTGQLLSVGGRGELRPTGSDLVTFDADFMRGAESQNVIPFDPASMVDSNLGSVATLAGFSRVHWEHRFSRSDLALQAYYSDNYRAELGGSEREHFLDFDFQDHLPYFHRNDVIWGLGYRLNTDHLIRVPITFSSDRHLNALYSLFVSDDYAVVRNKLVVTGGFKLEHNSYTGFEFQPNVRALWTPDSHHTLWASVSRAVRTPSIQDLDLHLLESEQPENGLSTEALALGNPNFRSESVVAYESGYRQPIGDKARLDVTSFINNYSNLRNEVPGAPYMVYSPGPLLIIPIMTDNGVIAQTHGVEVAASAKSFQSLQLKLAYTWLVGHITLKDGTPTTTGDAWSSPTNTVSFRPAWTFARHWTLNSSLYFVSRLERPNVDGTPSVRAFVRLDEQVSFSLLESLKLTAGVNNVLQSHHPEFDPTDGYSIRSQVPRSAFLKAVWSF